MSNKSMYFCSENVVETLKEGLNPSLTGISKEQRFGSGFYFFHRDNDAQNEIGLQGLNVVHPVVMSAEVALVNPVRIKSGQTTIHDAFISVSPQQILQIMHHNERIFDSVFSPLLDWKEENHNRISEELINEVCEHFSKPEHFWSMEKALFGDLGEAKFFREAVYNVVGYDGVIVELENGKENMVAWFSEQVSNMEIHKVLPKPEIETTHQRSPEPVAPELRLSRSH